MRVRQDIFEYITQNILPEYKSFDKAHDMSHANKVIENSLSIAKNYDVDINKVYVIAAYHDLGLSKGRKEHEKNSALFLLSDSKLREWFLEDELILMAEAVEDHRASNEHEPRSIYGKIVSEADRDIDYGTILARMAHYSLDNFPNYTSAEHFARANKHIQEKYGENGYLKLWLDTEINRSNLTVIRENLKLVDKFEMDFYNALKKCRTMKYTFSLAAPHDAPQVLDLYRSLIGAEGCAWNMYYPDRKVVDSDIQNRSLYILKDGDKIIAAAYVGKMDELAELEWASDNPCELARLGVARDMHKKGMATILLEHIKYAAIERGFDGIVMMVSKNNPPALALYEKNGFERCGEVFMFDMGFYCYHTRLNI